MTSGRAKVRFLLGTADGTNGVARSVFTTAGHLAPHYDVTVIGLFQRKDRPVYDVPPGVRLTFLQDLRPKSRRGGPIRRRLAAMPSRIIEKPAPGQYRGCSLLTDLLLLKALQTMRSGVLITTRPELHIVAARFAPRRLRLLAQEHMNYPQRPADLRRAVAKHADRLSAIVVLTERDREDYLRKDGWPADKVLCIPNSMPWSITPADPSGNKVVIGAGRLDSQKGFDRLVEAYAPLARSHPDWEVRIYGKGRERQALQAMIDEREIGNQVKLMGWTDRLGELLTEGSVFALPSRFEGLPLVGSEAMSKGLPLVAFDCPRGPRELVRDGANGFLIPDGDIPAFTSALDKVMSDADLRSRLGQEALSDARRFEISAVGKQWETLLDRLT